MSSSSTSSSRSSTGSAPPSRDVVTSTQPAGESRRGRGGRRRRLSGRRGDRRCRRGTTRSGTARRRPRGRCSRRDRCQRGGSGGRDVAVLLTAGVGVVVGAQQHVDEAETANSDVRPGPRPRHRSSASAPAARPVRQGQWRRRQRTQPWRRWAQALRRAPIWWPTANRRQHPCPHGVRPLRVTVTPLGHHGRHGSTGSHGESGG